MFRLICKYKSQMHVLELNYIILRYILDILFVKKSYYASNAYTFEKCVAAAKKIVLNEKTIKCFWSMV